MLRECLGDGLLDEELILCSILNVNSKQTRVSKFDFSYQTSLLLSGQRERERERENNVRFLRRLLFMYQDYKLLTKNFLRPIPSSDTDEDFLRLFSNWSSIT